MTSIGETEVRCETCRDSGYVCENYPDRAWSYVVGGEECCGGAGMPCPNCCSPIPEDGTHWNVEAFVPDWMRDASRS